MKQADTTKIWKARVKTNKLVSITGYGEVVSLQGQCSEVHGGLDWHLRTRRKKRNEGRKKNSSICLVSEFGSLYQKRKRKPTNGIELAIPEWFLFLKTQTQGKNSHAYPSVRPDYTLNNCAAWLRGHCIGCVPGDLFQGIPTSSNSVFFPLPGIMGVVLNPLQCAAGSSESTDWCAFVFKKRISSSASLELHCSEKEDSKRKWEFPVKA